MKYHEIKGENVRNVISLVGEGNPQWGKEISIFINRRPDEGGGRVLAVRGYAPPPLHAATYKSRGQPEHVIQ
jgi:hypothetical protein